MSVTGTGTAIESTILDVTGTGWGMRIVSRIRTVSALCSIDVSLWFRLQLWVQMRIAAAIRKMATAVLSSILESLSQLIVVLRIWMCRTGRRGQETGKDI